MALATNILVIEDDEAIRDALCDLLRDEGFSVACACDGVEGLAQIERSRPRLVLLDWWMPRMDGGAFLRVWQGSAAFDPALPIVLMTGVADQAVVCDGLPVAGYMRKPVEMAALLAVVLEHCGPGVAK